ncbi:hypothetical protein BH09BAC2_BH09BAC2_03850 [soil metagenome]
MKFYLGVTDNNWFNFLANRNPEEANFWQPGGNTVFKIISSGAPFLFKLKGAVNAIGGIGFFSSHTYSMVRVSRNIFIGGT